MLKTFIRFLKTSPLLVPLLVLIDLAILLVDTVARLTTTAPRQPKSLLIIRLDVMGDYLLFRNYLHQIKASSRYGGYRLTLLGNVSIKSLAETFDADVIDQFIWVDIYKLTTQPLYRFRVVRQLRLAGFSAVFCPTYSRVLVLDDYLALATEAAERVGCRPDYSNIKPWEARWGNTFYTRLIDSGNGIVFEMERDHRIVQEFLQEEIPIPTPVLNTRYAKPVKVPDHYIVFSLGAGQDFRVWPAENFAQVAAHLSSHYPLHKILLTGAASELVYAERFLACLTNPLMVVDLTGKLSIPELIYVLSKADLLIANETGIIHIAASTQTPTLVISQGKSLVRWHPYPAASRSQITYLYPSFIEANRHRLSEIAQDFNPESPYFIQEISVARVIDGVMPLLPAKST